MFRRLTKSRVKTGFSIPQMLHSGEQIRLCKIQWVIPRLQPRTNLGAVSLQLIHNLLNWRLGKNEAS